MRNVDLSSKLKLSLKSRGKPEQKSCTPGTQGRPFAENHDCQCDKSTAIGHSTFKRSDCLEGQVGSGKARYCAASDHIHIAHKVYVDTNCVGGAGMLADSASPQAPACEKQDIVHDKH